MMSSKWTAEKIRALRKKHKLSQARFVEYLPISIDALQHYEQERGDAPPLVCWALDRLQNELAAKANGDNNGRVNGKNGHPRKRAS